MNDETLVFEAVSYIKTEIFGKDTESLVSFFIDFF